MNTLNRFWIACSTWLFLFSLLISVFIMASCSGTGNYGRLAYNDNVKKAFETYQLPPNHNYYYNGPTDRPNAVIGIRDQYFLESTFWEPVKPTEGLLKKWLERKNPRHGDNMDRNGRDILSPDGRQIGIWYTVKNGKDRATVKMIDDKTVNVSPPWQKNTVTSRAIK